MPYSELSYFGSHFAHAAAWEEALRAKRRGVLASRFERDYSERRTGGRAVRVL